MGLIAYLCTLFQDGEREPLVSFLDDLKVGVSANPLAVRKWNSIDLAILDATTKAPQILVEMKVDDHEHNTKRRREGLEGPQTVVYAKAFPEAKKYLCITLGMGEFHPPPAGDKFDWICLRRFLQAVEAIKTEDRFIKDWRDSLRHEADRQDRVKRLDRTRIEEYRGGAWNIYLLGFLKEALALRREPSKSPPMGDATCYSYGSRPDTILNFGWAKSPAYTEISYRGRLNFKMNLEHLETEAAKRREIDAATTTVAERYAGTEYAVNRRSGKVGKSETIASSDVGLVQRDGDLDFAVDQKKTCEMIEPILQTFFDERPWPGTASQ